MNKREAAQVISIMQTNYPDSFRGQTDEMVMAKISLWAQMFRDDDASEVTAAVMAHMASSTDRFMPPVGVIKAMLHNLRQPQEMTAVEAWNIIRNAVRNSTWDSKKEFDALPPPLQKLVGSPNQLRDWAAMDSEVLNSVVASNVQRAYRTMQERGRQEVLLPAGVRNVIGGAAQRMALEE